MTIETSKPHQFVLKATCKASSGIVAAVTTFLSERGCYISELAQFDDVDTGRFFMRAVGHIESGECLLSDLRGQFPEVAEPFQMQWELHAANEPTKVLIMVSKFDHCLDDLLYRLRKGELNIEVTAMARIINGKQVSAQMLSFTSHPAVAVEQF